MLRCEQLSSDHQDGMRGRVECHQYSSDMKSHIYIYIYIYIYFFFLLYYLLITIQFIFRFSERYQLSYGAGIHSLLLYGINMNKNPYFSESRKDYSLKQSVESAQR